MSKFGTLDEAQPILALIKSNDDWILSRSIITALGLKNSRGNHSITGHWKDVDEWMGDDTAVVTVTLPGGATVERRAYSKKGVIKIALRARTPVAKAFQQWAAGALDDILDGSAFY